MKLQTFFAHDPADSDERRVEKFAVFLVGINSGPLVAGVIGQSKSHYDLWGDTAYTASRMESHGQAGKAQMTRATYDLFKDDFECVARGRSA